MKSIKPEDLLKFKFVSDARISPNGENIVYVVTRIYRKKNKYQYASNLWMFNIKSGRNFQFTFGNHRDTTPRWSRDSKYILFLRSKEDTKHGPELFIISSTGGEARKALDFEGIIIQFEWAPKGYRFLFTGYPVEKKEKEREYIHIKRVFYKINGRGYIPQDKRIHLYIASIGRKPKKITEGEFDIRVAKWHPDGKSIGVITNINEDAEYVLRNFVYLVDINTGKMRPLTPEGRVIGDFAFSPDGQLMATLEVSEKRASWANPDLIIYDLESGKRKNLLRKFDIDFGNALNSDVRGGRGGDYFFFGKQGIYFIAEYKGSTNIFLTDLKGNISPLTEGDHVIEGFSLPRRENILIYTKQDILSAPEIYIKEKEEKKITAFNTRFINTMPLGQPLHFNFTASDGEIIDGWLLLPPDFNKNKKYPLVLEIHGGPHTSYGNSFMFEFHYLASLGYIVAFTNPRGSSGYGSIFKKRIHKNWGDRDFKDIMEAIEFITSHYKFVDNERLGVTGGSYGGYMTNWIITHTDIFKAAVTQRSLSNHLSFAGTCDFAYYFAKFEFQKFPFDAPRFLLKNSPLMYVRNVTTPLLIIHSLEDHRTPVEQAEQLYTALKALKKDVEMVIFKGENHDLSRSGKPHNRIERLKFISGWFEKYLK